MIFHTVRDANDECLDHIDTEFCMHTALVRVKMWHFHLRWTQHCLHKPVATSTENGIVSYGGSVCVSSSTQAAHTVYGRLVGFCFFLEK